VWEQLPDYYHCDKANNVNVLAFYGADGDRMVPREGSLALAGGVGDRLALPPHNYWMRFIGKQHNDCSFTEADYDNFANIQELNRMTVTYYNKVTEKDYSLCR
jgi:hypothetical protein